MFNNFKNLLFARVVATMCACSEGRKNEMGSYGYDGEVLTKHGVEYTELVSEDGQSKVMIVPGWQARVMTTSAAGNGDDSYGWINYRFIESGEKNPQFNPYGGEERFWFGPEGGPYSLYFRHETEQVYDNWIVPPVIDTEAFELSGQGDGWMTFTRDARLADVLDMPIKVVKSDQACALGAAMLAAVAAGIHSSLRQAQEKMRAGYMAEYAPAKHMLPSMINSTKNT